MEKINQHQNASDEWKAALYLRLSKEDGDKEESDSITNQRELLRSHVQKNLPDVTIADEKVDLYSSFLIQCNGYYCTGRVQWLNMVKRNPIKCSPLNGIQMRLFPSRL